MTQRDYYEVLGVTTTATKNEISTAYRRLAIKYHPDKNPGDEECVIRFKECAEAYEVLSDDEKRARYDQFGHAGVNGPSGGGSQFHDVNDIFSAFGDIFGDIFGGGQSRGGQRVRRGSDVKCQVTLDLLEAARGVTKTIRFRRMDECETCNGTGAQPGSVAESCSYCGGAGQVIQASGIFRMQTTCPNCRGAGSIIRNPCGDCSGHGYVEKRVEREVRIHAGVDERTRLRMEGEGNPSPNGGPRGDCYIFVEIREHPLFHRDGSNLLCRIPITYTQAALGAEIDVPTLDGQDKLTIPAGSQSGQTFPLRGRGMPEPRRGGRGDLFVETYIEVPKKITPEQEELLRQLAETEHTHVSPHRKSFFEKVKEYISSLVHETDEPAT